MEPLLKILNSVAPVLLLLVGLVLMGLASLVPKNIFPSWFFLLVSFIVLNLAIVYGFNLTDQLRSAWSFYKVHHLVIGIILGLLPIGCAYGLSVYHGQEVTIAWEKITAVGILTTLAIVSWEELWFRGMPLELGALRYTVIGAAVVFGALFLGLHALNPNIHLLKEGPELFLAGYALSICYFAFGNIWAPIGMHFANNFTEALLKENGSSSIQNQRIAYVLVLALVAILLTFLFLRKSVAPSI